MNPSTISHNQLKNTMVNDGEGEEGVLDQPISQLKTPSPHWVRLDQIKDLIMQILVEKKQILPKPRRGWVANQLNYKAKQLQLTEKVISDHEFT